jgi:hypothetical protein
VQRRGGKARQPAEVPLASQRARVVLVGVQHWAGEQGQQQGLPTGQHITRRCRFLLPAMCGRDSDSRAGGSDACVSGGGASLGRTRRPHELKCDPATLEGNRKQDGKEGGQGTHGCCGVSATATGTCSCANKRRGLDMTGCRRRERLVGVGPHQGQRFQAKKAVEMHAKASHLLRGDSTMLAAQSHKLQPAQKFAQRL